MTFYLYRIFLRITNIFIFPIIFLVLFTACGSKGGFEVQNFDPMVNYQDTSIVRCKVDLRNAIVQGIVIPTKNGVKDQFKIKFSLKNNSNQPKRYLYKIYYQNCSYGHELYLNNDTAQPNPQASENFYGSWSQGSEGFHITSVVPPADDYGSVEIVDSFCIQGNPRNEEKYFGGKRAPIRLEKDKVDELVKRIKSSPEWVKEIDKKAKKNRIKLADQIRLDAEWTVKSDQNKGHSNNRWKRNPRMGEYEFLLVCVEEEDLHKLPPHVQNISKLDTVTGKFKNPFYYFAFQDTAASIQKIYSKKKLKLSLNYDLTSGIYLIGNDVQNEFNNKHVNGEDSMFYHASLEQYFHSLDKKHYFNNIPLSYDVVGENYAQFQFKENAKKFAEKQLIKDHIRNNDTPGKTVGYDAKKKAIFIKNLGSDALGKFAKENVGIKSRQGLTYGKYTAQIYFPDIVNDDYVWNGLTCAFWLIYQDGDWNTRSSCESGYHSKLYTGGAKKKASVYSEIDIEIVKSSKYWPKTSYPEGSNVPVDSALNKNLILSCTNWDLACHDPSNFNIGVKDVKYQNQNYTLHRWDDDYKAVTSKFELPHDSVMGRLCFFQIDWQPTRIIWRAGASKEDMVVIGYMDSSSTMIPNNQMEMVITQEFHLANWWPLTPFKQGEIPYPKNDIVGYLYGLEVE